MHYIFLYKRLQILEKKYVYYLFSMNSCFKIKMALKSCRRQMVSWLDD